MNDIDIKPISITEDAQEYILSILQKSNAKYFRIAVKTSGCSGLAYAPTVVNELQADDILVEMSDVLSVAIAKEAIAIIHGTVIDLERKTLGQKLLVYNNPNVESSCGCGESFQVQQQSSD